MDSFIPDIIFSQFHVNSNPTFFMFDLILVLRITIFHCCFETIVLSLEFIKQKFISIAKNSILTSQHSGLSIRYHFSG